MIVGRIFLYAVVAFAFAARSAASLMVRDQAPDFTAMAVVDGKFEQVTLSELTKAGKYVVLFTYPFDFTFVCPTEILTLSEKAKELKAEGVEVLGISCVSHHVQLAWTRTPLEVGGLGSAVSFNLVAVVTLEISRAYGVLTTDPSVDYVGAPLRGVFIIDPTGTIRSITVNDEQVGRNIEEIVRVVRAFQHSDKNPGVGCPANWAPGKETIKANPWESREFFKKHAGQYDQL